MKSKTIGKLAGDLNRLDSDEILEVMCCLWPPNRSGRGVFLSDLMEDFGFESKNHISNLIKKAQDRGYRVATHNGSKITGREVVVAPDGWDKLNADCEAYWLETRPIIKPDFGSET